MRCRSKQVLVREGLITKRLAADTRFHAAFDNMEIADVMYFHVGNFVTLVDTASWLVIFGAATTIII